MTTRYRITAIALTLLALVGCITTGGCGTPTPPPTSPVQAVAVIVHDFVSPERAVEGVAVICNGTARGTTNADGYLETTAATGEHFECTLTKDGYRETVAAFRPRPPTAGCDDCQLLRASLTALPPPAPPHPVSVNATVGRLEVADGFVDATGPVLPLYAHAGNLFSLFTRDRGRALQQLDVVAAAGYRGVRVWSSLGGAYWAGDHVGPDVTPDYWAHVEAFARALTERGLRAVWSQGDVGQIRDRRAYMTRLAAVDAAVPFIDFIDCGNEAWQTGEPDPARLAQCVGYYQAAGGLGIRSLTSPPGETKDVLDAFSVPPAQVWDVHSWRDGHWYDKRRHIFSIPYEQRPRLRYGINSEPPGGGVLVSASANKHELDDEAVAMFAAAAAIGRQAFVWFSGEGVKIRTGLETEPGFWSSPKVTALLPRDVMRWPTLFHSGTTFAGTRILAADGEVRIDCAQNGPQFACTIDGPSGDYALAVERSFAGRLCHPGTGACTDVSATRGQRLPVSFTRGRVFVGRLQ